jgi:hypothetical protein
MPADIETVAADLRMVLAELAALRQRAVLKPILTTAEAIELAALGSRSAFNRWAQAWKVTPTGHGRYARRAILAALEREANSVIPRRRTPVRSA